MLMQVTVTDKVRLKADEKQLEQLLEAACTYRDACNYVSAFVFSSGTESVVGLHRSLYRDIRARFGLKAQMAQSVFKTVVAKYRTVRANGHERTQVRFAVPQIDLVHGRDWSLVQGRFSVNTLGGRLRLEPVGPGLRDGRYGTAKLVVDGRGRVFLHVPVTLSVDVPERTDIVRVVGIDRGIRKLVATYDGSRSAFVSGSAVKAKRAGYARLRKELQRRGTPSARRRLKRVGSRENRWMRDVNHCIVKALAESNPRGTLFVLEDLKGVRAQTERVKVRDRYVSVSWAYHDLGAKLTYKAHLHGQEVLCVPPAYTSQRCPVCGHIDRHSRNKVEHSFSCTACGYRSDDDRVGAMNLYLLGLDYLNGDDSPSVQSPSGKPGRAGCGQSPHDVTPCRRAAEGGRAAPVCTSGQLQAHEFIRG